MTVYVDNAHHAFGRMIMCHCWADSRDELFAMMDHIGVQRKWFQRPDDDCNFGMKASWEHFDIAINKRNLAVLNGAVEVCQFTMAEHANRQNFLKHCERGHWPKAFYALRMMCLANNTRNRRDD